ncbi:MAG: metallophosphoesterase [Bacteroidota bacterium]
MQASHTMTDLIGDIHGHADALERLLQQLGYIKKGDSYAHPERMALFVGDYIDRGPQIRETLHIVKSMVENGQAIALMGNHEYNALCFHVHHPEGGHLRAHQIKNIVQHYQTLEAFHGKQREYEDYLEWFKTLPLFYENEQFRAVHACWLDYNIGHLQPLSGQLNDEHIRQSVQKGHSLYHAFDQTLKGIELSLPAGMSWFDHEKNERFDIRTRWWDDPKNQTYRQISVEEIPTLPDSTVEPDSLPTTNHYAQKEKPLFFGHYWLKGDPKIIRHNVCCLDFSIAKGGKLVAYRYDGEGQLNNAKLVYV